jgi:hypothetical protein
MRITTDIHANDLVKIQKMTGEKRKSPAIAQALAKYLTWCRRRKFVQRALSGKTDFSATNDDLEKRDI